MDVLRHEHYDSKIDVDSARIQTQFPKLGQKLHSMDQSKLNQTVLPVLQNGLKVDKLSLAQTSFLLESKTSSNYRQN